VVDAQAMGSIAVIRSLGRAGYPVHACSAVRDSLGLRSRYATSAALCPDYNDAKFIPWLRHYVSQNNIRAIVPSEGFLIALRANFDEFAELIPFGACARTIYAGLSKFDLFATLLQRPESATQLPPTLLVPNPSQLPDMAELDRLGYPVYIKTDGVYSLDRSSGGTYKARSYDEARVLLQRAASQFRRFIVQGHVSGRGVGVFFLIWQGQVIADFMHRRLHEVPHSGGASSLRESWWNQTIRDDALAKIQCMHWQGVTMLEYRWDRKTEKFFLIEMNGRFWGSLHLALYSQVDFPSWFLDCFHGHCPQVRNLFPVGIRCRHTFPKEVHYVWSRLKDRRLTWYSQLWSVVEFFQLMADPRVYSDLLFPGDRKLYWINFKNFLLTFWTKEESKADGVGR